MARNNQNPVKTGDEITIVKLRPDGSKSTEYGGCVMESPNGWIVAHANWIFDRLDLGYMVFEPGDYFIEYFATESFYNAFVLYSRNHAFKGWYCNVTKPTWIEGDHLYWHDLYLDVVVTGDRDVLVLDEDELQESNLASHDPELHETIVAAKDELLDMITSESYPFADHMSDVRNGTAPQTG